MDTGEKLYGIGIAVALLACIGLLVYVEQKHSEKINAMMAECMQDKKEYECYALIRAPDDNAKRIANAAIAAGSLAHSYNGK